MRWHQTEFILKGVYLGLLVFVAVQKPTWQELAYVGLCTLAGLLICLGIAAVRKLSQGFRIRGRKLSFLLFLLLEHPSLVYAGVLLGLIGGAYVVYYHIRTGKLFGYALPEGTFTAGSTPEQGIFVGCVIGGALLGGLFWLLRSVQNKHIRLVVGMVMAAGLVGGTAALLYYQQQNMAPDEYLLDTEMQRKLAYLLLLGIPVFYLLTFASLVEESEIETAAICAALGASIWLLPSPLSESPRIELSETMRILGGVMLPLVLCYVYTQQILPRLRIFKHIFRGMSYASAGRFRLALISLGRALHLNPKNRMARQELWNVHKLLDFEKIGEDQELLALVNFELCLERAAALLMNPPTAAQHKEAVQLLKMVAHQRPELAPRCDYWQTVAAVHQKDYNAAAGHLRSVIAGEDGDPVNPHRINSLFPSWQLALTHEEMIERVGKPQLALPRRRMEAIVAIERHLAAQPQDASVWELKRQLYNDLTEAEYEEATQYGVPAQHFDYDFARKLGMAKINDTNEWERGSEYLRIAARGLPEVGPALFVSIAKASEKAGNYKSAWDNYELAKQVGAAVGPENLSEENRSIYFQVVKMLADSAKQDGDADKAIENYTLFLESPKAGVDTYRDLADMFEQRQDVWSALHATEHAFIHGKKTDKDLKDRKDKYYYSITPEELRARWEKVNKWFDFNYCVTKAKTLLDQHGGDLELLDWASHLVELAHAAHPSNIGVRLLRGRVQRLRGELAEAIEILDEIYSNKPEKFSSGDEEEAWFISCKLLGDLYLKEQPEKALECFLKYKNYPKSGADTYYKLGVAYEATGDWTKAANCYEQVTAYESHPMASSAHEALDRMRSASR